MNIRFLFLLLGGLTGTVVQALIGSISWYFETGDTIFSSPAVDEYGNIYFGSRDGVVYSLTAQGAKRWQFDGAEDWIDSSPALGDNGVLYIGSWDDRLYALDMATGALKWSYETGNLIIASPAIGPDGRIYLGSYDGVLYALEEDGSVSWTVGLSSEIEASVTIDANGHLYVGTVDGVFLSFTADGEERWRYDLSSGITADAHGVYDAAVIGPDGTIYVGSRNGRLFAFEPDGSLNWTFVTTDYIDASSVVDAEGNIYFAARDGYLYKVNALGLSEWEVLVGDVFYASPVLGADGLIYQVSYAGNDLSSVLALDTDGETVGQSILPLYNDASPTLTPDGHLLVGMYDGALYALDAQTTLSTTAAWPKFAFDLSQTGCLAAYPVGDPAVVATFPGVEAYDDDWYYLSWLGWFEGGKFPWIMHLEHGWLWAGGASASSYWFYDLKLGWFYVSKTNPDLFYRSATGSWLLYYRGSSVFKGGRWFFDYSSKNWFLDSAGVP